MLLFLFTTACLSTAQQLRSKGIQYLHQRKLTTSSTACVSTAHAAAKVVQYLQETNNFLHPKQGKDYLLNAWTMFILQHVLDDSPGSAILLAPVQYLISRLFQCLSGNPQQEIDDE